MLYESDLSSLLEMWKGRLQDSNSQDYHDAVNDCIYDLKWLIESKRKEEAKSQDEYYASLSYEELKQLAEEAEADLYCSSLEAQEQYY